MYFFKKKTLAIGKDEKKYTKTHTYTTTNIGIKGSRARPLTIHILFFFNPLLHQQTLSLSVPRPPVGTTMQAQPCTASYPHRNVISAWIKPLRKDCSSVPCPSGATPVPSFGLLDIGSFLVFGLTKRRCTAPARCLGSCLARRSCLCVALRVRIFLHMGAFW